MPQKTVDQVDDWLTAREAARVTKLAEQTLANLRHRGRGPKYTKLSPGRSGRIRYRRSDIETWLAGRQIASAA